MKAPTCAFCAFVLAAQITVRLLLKQTQPVLSTVWTIPGNATSGNTHQHLPVRLTMAADWQASSHPFLQQLCLESSDEVLSVS